MELYQLKTFTVVAEEENLTKAASRLFTTPPAVSMQIKALEEELQVKLFERSTRGMRLTVNGKILRDKAVLILQAATDFEFQARSMQSCISGVLRMGLNHMPAFLKVTDMVTYFQEKYNGIDLSWVSSSSTRNIYALRDGNLDGGFIFGPTSSNDLKYVELDNVNLVILAPKKWQNELLQKDWHVLAKLPWIYCDDYCPYQELQDQMFKSRGLEYVKSVQTEDEYIKTELVRCGIGLVLMEEAAARKSVESGECVMWNPGDISCQLSFAYLKRRKDEPLIEAMIDCIEHCWGIR